MTYGVVGGRGLRSGLLLGAASAALASVALPALAQQQGGQVETVVVTGSRIPQQGLYSSSPVTAVGQQEMKFEGTTDVTTLVNNLPAAFVDQNSGVSNGSSGTSNVDLRGLGSKRTLVLVNGTRLMPGDISDPVPDLNDIPAALVDHVEVLTGGASAVYGSDALAGVVNFIMRKDFEGIELDGTYSVTQNDNGTTPWVDAVQTRVNQGAYGFSQSKQGIWNGQTVDSTFVMGVNTANDKGNVTAYLGYRSVAAVLEQSRDFSECTLQSTGNSFGCAGSSNFNRFFSYDNLYGDIFGLSSTTYDYFECSNSKGTCGQFGGNKGDFVPYVGHGDQKFNYGALNYLQRPDTRYTGGFFAHYQENKSLDIYSSFMFADDHTVAQIAPSGLFLGGGHGLSGTVYVNCGNPLMTPNENFDLCGQLPGDTFNGTYWDGAGNNLCTACRAGEATLLIGRRNIEGGNRQDDLRHTAYRMNIGARGDLWDGWSYDVYAQYGETIYSENYLKEFSVTRVQNALQVDPATGKCLTTEQPGGDPRCIPLDIFTGLGSITGPMENYVGADGLKEGFTEEEVVSGNLTGDLGKWGGQSPWAKNPIAINIGSEYRQERLKLVTDQEFTTNDLYGQGAPTISVPASGFNVTEGFTEVKVPLVQDMPFVEDLELNGGYRYSSYNIAGSTSTYKYGVDYQPIDDFRLRASVQRAVRAPNVLELFSPFVSENFSGQDPCANATGNILQACVNEGVNNAGSALLTCPATQCQQGVQGNIHLKPETSDTRTAGLVFTPTFLDGFTATVDWFDIKVSKFISAINPNFVLNECYVNVDNNGNGPGQAYFCPFVHRSGSGQIFGTGFVFVPTQNTGYLKTRGIDYELNYQTDTANWWGLNMGTVSVNDIGTWLDTLVTEQIPITPTTSGIASQSPYNCAGLYGLTCGTPNPKWRNKFRVTWSTPWDLDISVAWRYTGAVSLDADTSNTLVGGSPGFTTCANGDKVAGVGDCADAHISSYSYFDLSGDWTVRDGVDLRAGVENIFDTEPPVIGTQQLPLPIGNGNTFPGVYDALGRTIFVAATVKY